MVKLLMAISKIRFQRAIQFYSRVVMKVSPHSLTVFSAILLLGLDGCGGGEIPVRPAKGKVVCNGKPITSGSITFTPIGTDANNSDTGKQASGALNSDGTFVLSTYGRFDGAIVGKHLVQFSGSGADDSDESEIDEKSDSEPTSGKGKVIRRNNQKSDCVQKAEITVEVAARGENDFTIELDPKRK